jgi:hypothetical protein
MDKPKMDIEEIIEHNINQLEKPTKTNEIKGEIPNKDMLGELKKQLSKLTPAEKMKALQELQKQMNVEIPAKRVETMQNDSRTALLERLRSKQKSLSLNRTSKTNLTHMMNKVSTTMMPEAPKKEEPVRDYKSDSLDDFLK